mmetsp:Transcript_32342/g.53481  ORF Transcript_32342/g.53481 Transcript_32342/m.53481 type:complete len:320 (-) Transcript_32342:45-1004(-)|eukprot:CAMPEP_0119006000 /NCGR_PEP_ID=MMETSP1176-20130426/2056_1 /TAXON_ID=265551 /ORGANISM="Synedropsis recta cf, Strain CCMP1620" /LENGTH=319 /DNA_ID=CAMNT_0006957879 /DNA_START=26 /DNA_END=985 /DNA_ORIENTATION=+
MNISLSSAAEKKQKKKGGVSYGLNSATTNAFGDDDDDDDDDDDNGRDQVNRDLLREQDALRQRASAAMKYDFDGTYDENDKKATNEVTRTKTKKKESRYMKDLLQQAKKRNYERDQAHERKLAKEQQAEDQGEFRGKEKFITSAYKKTLEERELWKQEEEAQTQQEERENVTKRSKDGLLSGFYGNFNKNVAMGGKRRRTTDDDDAIMDGGKEEKPSFLDGFEAADDGDANEGGNNNDTNNDTTSNSKPSFLDGFETSATAPTDGIEKAGSQTEEQKEKETTPTKPTRQAVRAEKMTQARLRYFQRRGMTEQEALQESY